MKFEVEKFWSWRSLKFEVEWIWNLKLNEFEVEEIWSWINLKLKKFEVENWNWDLGWQSGSEILICKLGRILIV